MKVLIGVCLVAVIFYEWPKGHWALFSAHCKCFFQDLIRSFALRMALIFLAAFMVDPIVLAAIQAVEHPIATQLIGVGGTIGRNINFWLFLLVVYGASKLFSLRRVSPLVLGVMCSAALTGLACTVLKVLVLRSRPAAELGQASFFNLNGYLEHKGLFLSFPSGDVALVAGAAGFLLCCVQDRFIRICIVLLPVLTSCSRIYLNRHWPSDTVLSLGLGLLIGNYVYRSYQAKKENYTQLPLTIRTRPLIWRPSSQ